MLQFSEEEIKKAINDQRNYRWYEKNSDFAELVELKIEEQSFAYFIEGVVEYCGYENSCSFTVSKENHSLIHGDCTCYYCRSNSGCGHVGFIMNQINLLEISEFPFSYHRDEETSKISMEEIRKKQQEILERRKQVQLQLEQEREEKRKRKEQERKKQEAVKIMEYYRNQHFIHELPALKGMDMQLEMEITDTGSSYYYSDYACAIRFRVGKKQKYVVKGIEQFIYRIEQQENHTYGKNLSFLHSYEAFDDASKQQIDYIKKQLQYKTMINPWYSGTNEIKITKSKLDEFFDFYKELETTYHSAAFVEQKSGIELEVEEENDGYRIYLKHPEHFRNIKDGIKYIYEINSRRVIRYLFDEQGKTKDVILNLLEDSYYIGKKDIHSFYKYVFSDIEEFVQFPIDFYTKFTHDEGEIRLYGDVDEESTLNVQIQYEYDGKQQEAFSKDVETPLSIDRIENYITSYADSVDYEKHKAYISNEEMFYLFLKEGLDVLSKECEIYISDALKQMNTSKSSGITVGVKVKQNLLELDIKSLKIKKEEVMDVLRSYQKKKKFHRLKNGELLFLEEKEWEELDQTLKDLNLNPKDVKNGFATLPMYQAFIVDSMEKKEYLQMERNKAFLSLVQNFKQRDVKEFKVPETYASVLREYQVFGYRWLKLLAAYGFGGILADDMGLGKTIQMMAFLESQRSKKPAIVICPASLIYNWKDEIDKFTKKLSVCCISGNMERRKTLIQTISSYDVIITSYDYIRRDVHLYENQMFSTIVLDEAQYIKNQRTKSAEAVKKLKGKYRFALSGTPIENSLAELWSIFDFLMPGYLYSYHYFQTHFEKRIVREQDQQSIEKLKQMVEPFILRRNKKEVLNELPEKIETNMYFHFNEEEEQLYQANAIKASKELKEMLKLQHEDGFDKISILAMLTRLRQIACEPRLVFEGIKEPSSKMKGCMELIHTLVENKQKILLFSSFTSILDLLSKELYQQSISFYTITGSTPKEKRRELVNAFQEDETSVFLISLKAGGTGLNLTAANAVIHFDPWWNVSAQNQASDRAYRIGQKNEVQVFSLLMKDSIEEKIQNLQMSKKALADQFIEQSDGSLASMNEEQLLYLLSMDK